MSPWTWPKRSTMSDSAWTSCGGRLLLVLMLCFCIPFHARHAPHAEATSLELALSSDAPAGDIRLYEYQTGTIRFHYTLIVSGDSNHTLSLAICVTVDQPDVAEAHLSKMSILPLSEDTSGAFNVSVLGLLVGRASLHVFFMVGVSSVTCGQHGADDLQELLRISETNDTREFSWNVSQASRSPSTPSSSSSNVGMHTGRHYSVVVLRRERAIDTVFTIGVIVLVVIINIGMGCKLDLAVVKATLRRPLAPITGFFSQFIIMPLTAFAATRFLSLEPGVALGLFAVGCCPGGGASNSYCYLLDGDVSLSITMTFISTVAAVGMVPLWLFTLGRCVSSTATIRVPFQNIAYSLLGLVGAVAVGVLLQLKLPVWARRAVTVSKVTIVVFIVFMCTVGVYANLYIFRLLRGEVMAAAAFLPYAGFVLGGLVALVLRMSKSHIITIAIETGIQNTGIAVILLLLSLDHPESDRSVVAPAASALFTPVPLWIAIAALRTRRRFCNRTTTDSTPSSPSPTVSTTNSSAAVALHSGSMANGVNSDSDGLWRRIGEKRENKCTGKLCAKCLAFINKGTGQSATGAE